MSTSEMRRQILSGPEYRSLVKDDASFNDNSDEFILDWQRVRSMIEHEDNLINQRMTWLIAINGFLFTAFFFSQSENASKGIKNLSAYLSTAIPLIGVSISFFILIALVAAMNQLNWIVDWWNWRKALDPRNFAICASDKNNLRHPKIVGFGSEALITHDLIITKVLPSLVIATWIVILGALAAPFLNTRLSIPIGFLILAIPVSALAISLLVLRFTSVQVKKKDQ